MCKLMPYPCDQERGENKKQVIHLEICSHRLITTSTDLQHPNGSPRTQGGLVCVSSRPMNKNHCSRYKDNHLENQFVGNKSNQATYES